MSIHRERDASSSDLYNELIILRNNMYSKLEDYIEEKKKFENFIHNNTENVIKEAIKTDDMDIFNNIKKYKDIGEYWQLILNTACENDSYKVITAYYIYYGDTGILICGNCGKSINNHLPYSTEIKTNENDE